MKRAFVMQILSFRQNKQAIEINCVLCIKLAEYYYVVRRNRRVAETFYVRGDF